MSHENFDFVKTNIKDTTLTSFYNYNANIPCNLLDEEFKVLQNLSKNTNFVIQKSHKGNSVVALDKDVYIKCTESLLSNKGKFEKVDTKKGLLKFPVNHEKQISKYLKSLKSSGALSVMQHKKTKAVGSRPGILYGLCKIHKNIVESWPPFRPILSAIGMLSYKLKIF